MVGVFYSLALEFDYAAHAATLSKFVTLSKNLFSEDSSRKGRYSEVFYFYFGTFGRRMNERRILWWSVL